VLEAAEVAYVRVFMCIELCVLIRIRISTLYIYKYIYTSQTDQSLLRLWGPFSVKAVRHGIVQSRNQAFCIVLTSSAKELPLQITLLHVVPTAACILTY